MQTDHGVKQKARQAFTVPATSGVYAPERIQFGTSSAAGSGEREDSYMGVTWLMEGDGKGGLGPTNAVAELWLSRVPMGDTPASGFADTDFFFSGQVATPVNVSATVTGANATYGMATVTLSGWPLMQIRVRSGGTAGTVSVSATAF